MFAFEPAIRANAICSKSSRTSIALIEAVRYSDLSSKRMDVKKWTLWRALARPADNPMGTDGFEFVEFAHPEPAQLGAAVREVMGFVGGGAASLEGRDPLSARRCELRAQRRARQLRRRFQQAPRALGLRHGLPRRRRRAMPPAGGRARRQSRSPVRVGPMELNIPAIEGVGGALIYLVDRYGEQGSIWDVDFRWTERPRSES